MKKILVISVAWIWNTILATSFIKNLRNQFRDYKIDLLTFNKAQAEVLLWSKICNNYFWFEKWFLKRLKLLWKLKKQNYDYSVIVIPSNRVEYNILNFIIWAKKRVIHKYNCCYFKNLFFLSNVYIKANPEYHDVENNMLLLKAFWLNDNKIKNLDTSLYFHLDKKDIEFWEKWIKGNNINWFVLWVHPWAWPLQFKKWWIDNFVKKIVEINKEHSNMSTIIFGWPDEENEKQELKEKLEKKWLQNVFIFSWSLKQTASIIRKCDMFLSNDSGLMHIASTFWIKQLAVFKASNWKRAKPWNKNSKNIILNKDFNFSKAYPFYNSKR